MTIARFVVLTAGLAIFHPSNRQPLTGTQKLREGIGFLSQAIIGIQAMQDWYGNQSQGDEDTDLSALD